MFRMCLIALVVISAITVGSASAGHGCGNVVVGSTVFVPQSQVFFSNSSPFVFSRAVVAVNSSPVVAVNGATVVNVRRGFFGRNNVNVVAGGSAVNVNVRGRGVVRVR